MTLLVHAIVKQSPQDVQIINYFRRLCADAVVSIRSGKEPIAAALADEFEYQIAALLSGFDE